MGERKDSRIWNDKKKELYTWQPKGMPEMRKPGWIIFLEIMKENFAALYSSAFIFLVALIPASCLFYISIRENSILFALLAGLLGGIPGGPCLAGAFDTTLRCMRKENGYWKSYYPKAWKQNWKQAMQFGIPLGIIISIWMWMVHLMYIADVSVPVTVWISLVMAGVLLFMVIQYIFAQLVLVTITNGQLLRNSCLLTVVYLPKSLVAGLFSLIYFGLMAAGMPYTLLFLITTGAWTPVLVSWMALYDPVNITHHVDEKKDLMEEEKYRDMF